MFTETDLDILSQIGGFESTAADHIKRGIERSICKMTQKETVKREEYRRKLQSIVGEEINNPKLLEYLMQHNIASEGINDTEPAPKRAKKCKVQSRAESFCKQHMRLAPFEVVHQLAKQAYDAMDETLKSKVPFSEELAMALFWRVETLHMPALLNAIAVTLALSRRARLTEPLYRAEIAKLYSAVSFQDNATAMQYITATHDED